MFRPTSPIVHFPGPPQQPFASRWVLVPVLAAVACVALQFGSVLPGQPAAPAAAWCEARSLASALLVFVAPWLFIVYLGALPFLAAARLCGKRPSAVLHAGLRQAGRGLLCTMLLSWLAVSLADEPTARLAAHYAAPALTETRLALGAYRRDHGDWPRDLDTLVPAYLPVVRAPGLPCCPEMRYRRGVVWVKLPSGVFRHVLAAGAVDLRGVCCDFTEMSGVWYSRLWIQYGDMPPLRRAPVAHPG